MHPLRKKLSQYSLLVFIYHFGKKLAAYPSFFKDLATFRKLSKNDRFSIKGSDLFPCLLDKTKETNFEPHYTYHPAWAARVVAKVNPAKHVDISSTLYFSTMLSAFVPVDFYDYRPAPLKGLPGLASKEGDLLKLPFADNSVESISCLHTIEHIGLGRYGDVIDPDGDIKAIKELIRVTKPGGTLIFVTPVSGRPRIEFNAHRIYSYDQVIDLFPNMELKEFSLVPDNFKELGLIVNADKATSDKQNWGCGCFWFIKK